MNIKTITENGSVTIIPDGRIDTNTADSLGAEIHKISEAEHLILDLANVEYISSAGIRQLLILGKHADYLNADFTIINTNSDVMNIFSLTGIDKKLNVVD